MAGRMDCSWTDKGYTYHLIVDIGFGVITTISAGVEVCESRILGGEFDHGVSLGWMEHHRTAIDPATDSARDNETVKQYQRLIPCFN